MNALPCRLGAAFALLVGLAIPATAVAQAPDKPLSEQELTVLISAGIDQSIIVERITKKGVSFDPAATLEKLKAAGASEVVLKAVQAAVPKPAAPAPGEMPAVTYDQLLTFVKVRIPDDAILASVRRSPTKFVLDARQVDALKAAGASDALLAALSGRAGPAAAAPVVSRDVSDLAIILDCSGSMREATKEGESKMDAAKRVVADLVHKIPNGVNVTLVIYGHEVYGGAEDARNCQAVKVARPLAPLTDAAKSDLAAFIGGLKPTGATPIALSLRTAGEELAKSSGLCGVVLVTDGIESCQGDPAAEAAALAAKLKLTFGVNVVSFGLKPEEDAAIKKIAEAGKGKFYAADNAKELTESLGAIAKEIQAAAKPPDIVGAGRRAVKILQPAIELLAMKEILLTEADAPGGDTLYSYVKAKTSAYGEEIRIPSGTVKYDLFWIPKEGRSLRMAKNLIFPDRKVIEIKPEDYLGLIRVKGTGAVKQIVAVPAGSPGGNTRGSYVTQEVKKFGELMIVPAGKYDVYVDENVIEEGLDVKPGKLHELE